MNWKKGLLFAVSFAILAWVVSFSNPAEVWARVRDVPWYYFVLFIVPTIVSNSLRTIRWIGLVGPVKKFSFREAINYQLSGLALSNMTPARVGEAGKVLLLKKYEGLPVSKTIQSVIWERLFDLIILLAISIPFLGLLLGRLEPSLMFLGVAGSVFVIAVCVVVFVAMRYRRVGMWLLKIVKRVPVVKEHVDEEFMESFYGTEKFSKGVFASSTVLSGLTWLADSFAIVIIFYLLGISFPVSYIIGGMFLSVLIGLVSFLPGGIGSSEFSYIVILMLLGLEKEAAAAGVLVGRAFTLGVTIVWGMIALQYLMWKK